MHESVTPEQRERFQRLMWPLIPTALRLARYLTHDEHEAEDLAQETMMRALRNIDRFEEGTDAKAWLLTVERRLFIDRERVRRRQLSLDHPDALEPADEEAPDAGIFDEQWEQPEDLLRRFGDAELIETLRALPEATRWTLLLVDVEGLEHVEAARVLDVAVGTIKSRASRGRKMLRDRLFERARARGWVSDPERKAT